MAHTPYTMFSHQNDNDDFTVRYDAAMSNPVFTSGPMGLTIPADAYGHMTGFESRYPEAPSNYILTSGTSPAAYHEDGDLRMPSSSLSTASATSSAIGSPQSNHGQMGSGPEWAPHGGMGAPSIVGNDYISAAEYAAFHGPPQMEEFAYDYHPHHNKRFVGKSTKSLCAPSP
jgi:hypothetical protein